MVNILSRIKNIFLAKLSQKKEEVKPVTTKVTYKPMPKNPHDVQLMAHYEVGSKAYTEMMVKLGYLELISKKSGKYTYTELFDRDLDHFVTRFGEDFVIGAFNTPFPSIDELAGNLNYMCKWFTAYFRMCGMGRIPIAHTGFEAAMFPYKLDSITQYDTLVRAMFRQLVDTKVIEGYLDDDGVCVFRAIEPLDFTDSFSN